MRAEDLVEANMIMDAIERIKSLLRDAGSECGTLDFDRHKQGLTAVLRPLLRQYYTEEISLLRIKLEAMGVRLP